jgi:hypothetical protein
MPNVYRPGLIQVKPQYTSGLTDEPDTPENILFFSGTTESAFPLTSADITAIAAVFDPHWGNMWALQGSSAYKYVGSVITDWSVDTGVEQSSVGVFAGTSGTLTGVTTGQACMLISYTASAMPRYRGGHFRTYLPYPSEAALVNPYEFSSTVTSGVTGGLTTLYADMAGVSGTYGGGYIPALYRFRNNPTKADVYYMTGYAAQQVPATQRRRLRKITRK